MREVEESTLRIEYLEKRYAGLLEARDGHRKFLKTAREIVDRQIAGEDGQVRITWTPTPPEDKS